MRRPGAGRPRCAPVRSSCWTAAAGGGSQFSACRRRFENLRSPQPPLQIQQRRPALGHGVCTCLLDARPGAGLCRAPVPLLLITRRFGCLRSCRSVTGRDIRQAAARRPGIAAFGSARFDNHAEGCHIWHLYISEAAPAAKPATRSSSPHGQRAQQRKKAAQRWHQHRSARRTSTCLDHLQDPQGALLLLGSENDAVKDGCMAAAHAPENWALETDGHRENGMLMNACK